MKALLPSVEIVEVGPRDGLQNERVAVPTATKVAFIRALVDAGLRQIEVTSFVHPAAVPQLADADEVVRQLPVVESVVYSALVPNQRGLERALAGGIRRIAVFTAASETFARKNIGMGVDHSLETFAPIVAAAKARGVCVRGYVSTAFVCPYEGEMDRSRVQEVAWALLGMGVDQVAIGDTIGAAAPTDVFRTVGHLLETISADVLALHFHDTYGTAMANVCAALELGIRTFDASAGGLGGCPFAPGASGNLATEDLVYLLDRMGIAHGVDLPKLVHASNLMAAALGRELPSRNWQRLSAHGGA